MNLDKNELEKITSMSDNDLRQLIMEITKAAGGSEFKAKMLTNDISRVKNAIASMTPEEASSLINKTGSSKSEEIYRMIKDKQKNGQ